MGEQNLTLNPSVPFDEKILKILEYVLPYTDTIMVVLLIICGIYYSFLTRFVQFRMLKSVFKILTERNENHTKEHISPFQALMISTASRVGIGILQASLSRSLQEERVLYFGCGLWRFLVVLQLLQKAL